MRSERGCHCDVMDRSPGAREAAGLPSGHCGHCCRCGRPGHLRHAAGAPYTDAWCDPCFRMEAVRIDLEYLALIAAVLGAAAALSWIVRAALGWLG